ncbi:MAG: YkgJ family cysteine cluster protein [Candidatus Bathyarchaeia archaeon]
MRYIPWTWITSWRCLACGQCCSFFRIVLRIYEYALITRSFGEGSTYIDSLGNPCLKKTRGRCIFQDDQGLCQLQQLGMKPQACKLWPFIVCKEPKKLSADAAFRHRGGEYYVYVDTLYPCPGINRGNPQQLQATIAEAIECALNSTNQQRHTTAETAKITRILHQTVHTYRQEKKRE